MLLRDHFLQEPDLVLVRHLCFKLGSLVVQQLELFLLYRIRVDPQVGHHSERLVSFLRVADEANALAEVDWVRLVLPSVLRIAQNLAISVVHKLLSLRLVVE